MSRFLSEFADKINEILPLFHREFASKLTKELFKSRVTLPQFLILMILDKERESNMSTLARAMNVSTAAMTGIVSRLVESRFAIRVNDPKDRRIIKVRLTSKGSHLADKLQEQRRQTITDLFKDISEEDRENYLRILTRIKDKLATRGKQGLKRK
jgi:DNA-binding MarR family transcriptional regulator